MKPTPITDTVTNHGIRYYRPQILVIFLVALALLFAGVRVPDLSRPHRPRATHRVTLETQHKIPSHHVKQHGNPAIVLPKLVIASNAISYHAISLVGPSQYASRLVPPNFGRSPPARKS